MGRERSLAGSEQSEGLAAVRALAFGARVIERALDDMTLPQFRVLTLIASSPERASRVAEKAAVSRPSLTGLLDGLEARGWVRRVGVDGDRRGVGLEVTPEGRAALRSAEEATETRLEHVLAELPSDERRAVLAGLDALGSAFAAMRAAAP
jgi:DNA-binding MarR family transcriptional regulator